MNLVHSFLLSGLLGLFVRAVAEDSIPWVSGGNCPQDKGVVTDSLCCQGDNSCSRLNTQKKCADDGEPYCEWTDDECKPVKDYKSDVCCIGKDVGNACNSMLNGVCPDDWQVDETCCSSEDGQKYKFLNAEDGKICCNAPCTEMEAANCTSLPAKCGPQQRSYAMRDPFQSVGFHFGGKTPFQHKFGYILHGTGFGRDLGHGYRRFKHGKSGYREEVDDYDYSKDDHVDEITMDDLMLMLVDALEKESDVKFYDADITSDPYLGKEKSGGLFVDHSFPHADRIFDHIYGSKGHYEHFVRPYEGYEKLYPEYRVDYRPQYLSHYRYPSRGHPSYSPYEPVGYGHHSYEAQGYGYQAFHPQSYQPQTRGYRGHGHVGYKGHRW